MEVHQGTGRQLRQSVEDDTVDIAARHGDVAGIDEKDVARLESRDSLDVSIAEHSRGVVERQTDERRTGLGRILLQGCALAVPLARSYRQRRHRAEGTTPAEPRRAFADEACVNHRDPMDIGLVVLVRD